MNIGIDLLFMENILGKILMVLVFMYLYYGIFTKRILRFSFLMEKTVLDHIKASRRYSVSERNSITSLTLLGIFQLVFCYMLSLITGFNLMELLPSDLPSIYLIYGILLGIGEMALASFIVHIIIFTAARTDRAEEISAFRYWMTQSKGGWLRQFDDCIKILPLPALILIVSLYIIVEEIIFRGILIKFFEASGSGIALGVSVFFFVLIQVFHTTSWRNALFPVIGALVVGILHGILFLSVPVILPLIIAHLFFFFLILL